MKIFKLLFVLTKAKTIHKCFKFGLNLTESNDEQKINKTKTKLF